VFNVDGKYDNVTRVLGSGSCSALVKLLPGNTDLYIAHDTWNSYQSMIRILKKYTLPYHWDDKSRGEHLIPGQTMSFSSYPGLVYSGDDFYLISTGLAVTETTIGNSNRDLWKYVKPTGQGLILRNSVAAENFSDNFSYSLYSNFGQCSTRERQIYIYLNILDRNLGFKCISNQNIS
jgi:hypothetical protein